MRLTIIAAVLAVSIATPAAADVVIFESSGRDQTLYYAPLPVPGAGRYRFEFTTSRAISYLIGHQYDVHWDIYSAGQQLDGNSTLFTYDKVGFGTSDFWEFDIPESTITDLGGAWIETWRYGTVPLGTPLFQEDHIENAGATIYSDWYEPFDYTVKLTFLSPVPEPATWAMMITGFGLAGSALRRRRIPITA